MLRILRAACIASLCLEAIAFQVRLLFIDIRDKLYPREDHVEYVCMMSMSWSYSNWLVALLDVIEQPVITLRRGRGGHCGGPSLVRRGVFGPRGGQNQSPKIPDKAAITPIASRPGAVVEEGEGESLTSSLWESIWYNCDALTRRCLGNALDEPK